MSSLSAFFSHVIRRSPAAITIIGAGLGGLMLARILHLHGLDVVVYDTDASSTSRHQGGMLDIHEESGQAALRAGGLLDAFHAFTLEGGDATRVLDKTGTAWVDQIGNGQRPEIDRGALRDLLVASLPPTMIRWGSRVVRVSPLERGGYEVTFADGRTVTTAILIGADGAWSKVRPLLSAVSPVYSGLSFVEVRIQHAPERHPHLAAIVGSGLMFALSDAKGVIAHREPNGELCVYAALYAPADWTTKTVITRESLLTHFSDWHPDLRALLAQSDGALMARPLYALPVGHRWQRRPGVTLLGDAAHLMSPFAGEGANLALQDGAELAQAILENPDDIEAAFARYEEPMFTRSQAAAAASEENLAMCFNSDAPQGLVTFFQSMPV